MYAESEGKKPRTEEAGTKDLTLASTTTLFHAVYPSLVFTFFLRARVKEAGYLHNLKGTTVKTSHVTRHTGGTTLKWTR
jgi:hypothetical protein